MDLGALSRLISAVRTIAPEPRILLFGSSSLLASFPSDPPEAIGVELTLDADFFLDPDDAACRAQLTERLGRNQDYHQSTGQYGDFVDLRLSESFPEGWRDRLVPMPGFNQVWALHPVDMAVTKIAATARSRLGRRLGKNSPERGMKDINTIVALLQAGRLDHAALTARLQGMDYEPALIVECWQVMEEIIAAVKRTPPRPA